MKELFSKKNNSRRGAFPRRDELLPLLISGAASVFLIVFFIADIPVLTMPHSVAVVQSVGTPTGNEDNAENMGGGDYIPYNANDAVYVRYVAMGEERVCMLKGHCRGLEKGDGLIVAYSSSDPYDIERFMPFKCWFDISAAIMLIIIYILLWRYYCGE